MNTLRRHFSVEPLEGRQLLSTINVTTTIDDGSNTAPTAGSLRAAILQANAQPAGTLTTIDFKIGTGPQSIRPPVALPQILRPVIIDGTTQPGYAGQPIIDVDGDTTSSGVIGFSVASTASGTAAAPAEIKGLEITSFGGGGVLIQASEFNLNNDDIGLIDVNSVPYELSNAVFGVELAGGASNDSITAVTVASTVGDGVLIAGPSTSHDTLTGDRIGTDPTGTLHFDGHGVILGNLDNGVVIDGGATHITIANSVSSNNGQQGILISGLGTQFNTITGDDIGTSATGNAGLPNRGNGVLITSSASFNTIGGTTAGARDIISSNIENGVELSSSGTSDNLVEGDYIGTDSTGSNDLANDNDGVDINSGATLDTIGGTTAGARDVISGDDNSAVLISDPGTSHNLIEGDYIGPNAAGTSSVFNCDTGVTIENSATYNTVGGTTAGACNVISGNAADGIFVDGSGTARNLIEGNDIGTDATGENALPNGDNGVAFVFLSGANTLGGGAAGARNIISGNTGIGVVISGSVQNVIAGDFIGTDATGTKALANGGSGLLIEYGSTTNTVGGTTAGAIDLISGNSGDGVVIFGSSENLVEGDFIGTDLTGTKAIANVGDGVVISGSATFNTVGGTTASARDVISGNGSVGVDVTDPGTSSNLIEGDFVGTNAAGTAAVPNGINGLDILSGATSNTVGGAIAGTSDLISGNTDNGVVLDLAGTSGNVIEGDRIGTDLTGTTALANHGDGVVIMGGATSNIIGGTTASDRDVISGNGVLGILVTDSGTSANVIEGDYIGTSAAGTAAVPNGINGIDILSAATANTVGGTIAAARDVVSGNTYNGVVLGYAGTSSNVIEGDYIGNDVTGTKRLPNGGDGVDVIGGATYNTIGGTTPAALNLISGNGGNGVLLTDSGTFENVIEGNFIGTDETGTKPLGNHNGVVIQSASYGNLVGGVNSSARNVISGNTVDGVVVNGSGTNMNTIDYDYIGTGGIGELAVSNGSAGVVLENGASGTYVYHSLISANVTDGVLVTGTSTSDNLIMFDSIGLDATGLKAVNQLNQSFSNAIGVEISGATGTVVEASFVSGNGAGVVIEAAATGNSIYSNDIGTGADGKTGVGNVTNGVVLNGVTNNVVAYDLVVYNSNVGVLTENGSSTANNSFYNDTFTITVGGLTYGNKNGAEQTE